MYKVFINQYSPSPTLSRKVKLLESFNLEDCIACAKKYNGWVENKNYEKVYVS